MTDLVFKLILQTVDRGTAGVKNLVAQATAGNAKVIASTVKATAAVQKFKVAETSATLTAKQLALAAEGIKRGIQPTDALSRAIGIAKGLGHGLSDVLERIGASGALNRQAHDADKLAGHADHANHRLKAVLRSLVEMAELGPMGHLAAHLTPWIGAAAIGFAAIAGGRGIYEMGKSTGEYGADVAKRSQKVGLGDRMQDYQRLVYAANQSEVDQETLDTGLIRFSKFAYGAQFSKKGGNAAKALKDIGISARDSHGKLLPILQLLPLIADKFKAMPESIRKTGLATTLFSRSGANMTPMLNKGGAAMRAQMKDADDLGVVLSNEAIEHSEQFIRAQKRMGGALMGLKLQLGSTLLGPLTDATRGLTAFIVAHRPAIVTKFKGVIDSVIKSLPSIAKAIGKVDWGQFILALVQIAGGLAAVVKWGGGVGAVLQSLAALGAVRVVWMLAAGLLALIGLPVEGAVAAIVGIVAALAGMASIVIMNWGPISGFFIGIWKKITSVWSALPGFFSGLWDGAKASFLTGVANLWSALPGWLKTILTGAAIVAQISLGLPIPLPLPPAAKPPKALPPAAKLPKAPPPAAKLPKAISPPLPTTLPPLAHRPVKALNDNHQPALGAPRNLSASGPPASIRRPDPGHAAATPAAFGGTLHVHITHDGQVEVRHVETTEGFHIDVKRGLAA